MINNHEFITSKFSVGISNHAVSILPKPHFYNNDNNDNNNNISNNDNGDDDSEIR